MKRCAELQELSREHQRALSLAAAARRAAAADAATAARLCRRALDDFASEVEPHFRLEEDVLFPLLEQAGGGELVARALDEHACLRGLRESLAACDARALGQFGELLAAHVRFEERALFEAAQQLLDPKQLRSLTAA